MRSRPERSKVLSKSWIEIGWSWWVGDTLEKFVSFQYGDLIRMLGSLRSTQ